MARLCDLTELRPGAPTVLTIGVFDGVHRGHQFLIGQVVQRARPLGAQSMVLTFYPHPRSVLMPGVPVSELLALDDRLTLIASLGVDVVATLEFTHDLSRLSAEQFLDLVQTHVNLRELWGGHDFALGHKRAGTVAVLTELGHARGFTVRVAPPLDLGGEHVSSSRVRALIAAGDLEQAAYLLGRYPYICGTVILGVQRGRALGFPTANLAGVLPFLLPPDGVYAVFAELDGRRWPAVANIGVSPTFGGNHRRVEVHILDFAEEIYGRRLGVHLVKRLRDEVRFSAVADLVAQMHRDVAAVRVALAGAKFA